MAPVRQTLAAVIAGTLLALAPAALAAPRAGSGNDPDEGLGTNRDIAQVRSSYDPDVGRYDLAVRFHQPLSASPTGTVEVYFRDDDTGACAARTSDVRFRFDPDPATDGPGGSQVVAAPLGSPSLTDKTTSADRLEVTSSFTDSRLRALDTRCTYAQTTGPFTGDPTFMPPIYDRLEPGFYFTGFGPADLTDPVLTVTAPRTQKVGRRGAIAVTAGSNEAGSIEAIASVRVGRRSVSFRAATTAVTTPGDEHKLTLRLGRSGLSKVRAALEAGRRLYARVEITGDDEAGNSTSLVRKIRLRP